MTDFAAAGNDRLLGTSSPFITEPTYDWSRDARIIATRAQAFVCNDPFGGSMVAAALQGEHGPCGLRPRSLAYLDADETTSKSERTLRRQIETGLAASRGKAADVCGVLTRKQIDLALSWMAKVLGEGFAIRLLRPGRVHARYATCWRLIRPERVTNPDGRPNDDRLYEGFELDEDGAVVAIHIQMGRTGAFGFAEKPRWIRVPWYSDDGVTNVIHRVGWRLPGMLRGVSMFTPLLLLARQLGGVIESHVIGKRAQACTPIIYYVDDPEASAEAAKLGSGAIVGPHTKFNPLQVYYAKIGNQVDFKNTTFQGDDLQKFHAVASRVLCAVWQLPVEVVLAKMGEASLASARAGLDQFDRTCQTNQDDHITEASQPMDEAHVAEMVALGEIMPGSAGITGLSASRYSRPPKYSTDRKKDAETVDIYVNKLNRSKTASYAEFGWSFEDETEERIRDEEFENEARAAAGLPPLNAPTADGRAPDDEKPADDTAKPDDDTAPAEETQEATAP
jgi:capsid protein